MQVVLLVRLGLHNPLYEPRSKETMMRVALLAVVTCCTVLAAPAGASTETAPAPALRAYLTAVHPAVTQIAAGADFVDSALFFANDKVNGSDVLGDSAANAVEVANKAVPRLRIGLSKLTTVKAPADLRGPQSSLRGGATLALRAGKAIAGAFSGTDEVNQSVVYAESDGKYADAKDRLGQWRDELTVQLRRRGITVPLWVKQLGR